MFKLKFLIISFIGLFVCTKLLAQDKAKIAALETALSDAKTDKARIQILGDLCWNYSFISFDKALSYGQQELSLAETMRNDTAVALAYSDIGIVYTRTNNLNEALNWHQKAYALRKKLNLKDKAAASQSNIAVIYKQQGDYDKAAQSMMNVLAFYSEINDEPKKALVLNNIGLLYLHNNKHDAGRDYFNEALAIAQKLKIKSLEANVYTNLSQYYFNKKRFPDALQMCQKAIALQTELNATSDIGVNYNTIGEIYEKQAKYPEALTWYQKSLKIREQLNDQLGIGSVNKNIAQVYIDQKNFDDAEKYLLTSIEIFAKQNAKDYLQEAYVLSSTIKKARNQDRDALLDYKKAVEIKDSVLNKESLHTINELEVKYQTEKKEQQIQLLNKQNQIQSLDLKNQKLQVARRNLLLGFSVILVMGIIGFGFLLYNRYKLKLDTKLQAEVIHQQDLAAKGIIEAEERERKRIAGDLHDGIGQLFSTVRLNMSSLLERATLNSPEDKALAETTVAMVDESCKEVRSIAHQMMPNVLLKTGLAVAVKDFVNKIDAHKLKVTLETSGLNERLGNDIEIVLYRVIQECVNNVIKHAQASRLDIQLDRGDTEISVTIEDNGKGFDTGDREKFEGIGLKNILTRLAYLKGTAEFSSSPGKGTLVAIYVPIAG